MANACCSIETEPKTLNEGQLNRAREVAADVVHKMEPKEATTVFIERSRTSVPLKELERIMEELNQPPQAVQCEEKAPIVELQCQCSCTAATSESPDKLKLREPHSAPF